MCCNNLNQMVSKIVDGKDTYNYTYDNRGNLIKGVYVKNKNSSTVVEQYVYDASNRMVKGINEAGEESYYIYNGLGYLVANEWIIEKNNYGYTGVETTPSGQVGGVVVCDRHKNTTGQGHINPTGKGHTTGGTEGGTTPTISGKQAVVHKDYVLDYTSPLKDVIMEYESGVGGLTYRYVYGLEKQEVVIYGIPNGAGSVMQYVYDDETGELVLTTEDPGKDVVKNGIVKLYYHHDRLGSTDYLTDNVDGKVVSYVTYDDWGMLTAKAVLKMGVRELDLVQSYTTYSWDMVMGVYFAQARMYDAADRRFMAADWVKGTVIAPLTLVAYIYCLDNPVRYIDSWGLITHNQVRTLYDNYKSAPNKYKLVADAYTNNISSRNTFLHTIAQVITAFTLLKRGAYVQLEFEISSKKERGEVDVLATYNSTYYAFEIKPYENLTSGQMVTDKSQIKQGITQLAKYYRIFTCNESPYNTNPVAYYNLLNSGIFFQELIYSANNKEVYLTLRHEYPGVVTYQAKMYDSKDNSKSKEIYTGIEFSYLYESNLKSINTEVTQSIDNAIYAATGKHLNQITTAEAVAYGFAAGTVFVVGTAAASYALFSAGVTLGTGSISYTVALKAGEVITFAIQEMASKAA